MSTPSKNAVRALIDILQKGPKTYHEIFSELPQFSHHMLKKRVTRPLMQMGVAEMKKNHKDGNFYLQLVEKAPENSEKLVALVEKRLAEKDQKFNLAYKANRNVNWNGAEPNNAIQDSQ